MKLGSQVDMFLVLLINFLKTQTPYILIFIWYVFTNLFNLHCAQHRITKMKEHHILIRLF